jgi:hypothetical protein
VSPALLYVLGPVAGYLLLAALPAGPARRQGFGAATVVLVLLWLAWPLGWPPFGPDRLANAAVALVLLIWTLALSLAALLQTLRPRLAAWGPVAYPLAAAGALAFVLLAAQPAI